MKLVPLQVWVIAKTVVDQDALSAWISHCTKGCTNHVMKDRAPTGQTLIEAAGRRCYNSFAPGINSNVQKVREDQGKYLKNIISVKHGSVLEHTSITFAVEGVSRVVTHEWVRHRVGVAFSQESMRFVAFEDVPIPLTDLTDEFFERSDKMLATVENVVSYLEKATSMLRDLAFKALGYSSAQDAPMSVRKAVTSWLRRWLPHGMATGMVFTANLRALRHLIPIRTAVGAEEEIRSLFNLVAKHCLREYPDVFYDFERKPDGSWVCEYEKV